MTFRLGGFLLLFCSVATAAPFFSPNYSLFADTSNVLSSKCAFFSSFVKMFPLNYPKEENIFFQLRKTCERSQYPVSMAHDILDNPDFDVNKKTVVFIAGWMADMDEEYTESLTKAYLCRDDVNFIVVNPSDHLKTEYVNSAYNTEKIGEYIALGLKNLNIPGKDIHLIGHSLGSHIMGSAGRIFAKATNDKIARITGLDPARPCFIKTPDFPRLTTNDATFVDIIHSNPRETGTEEPIGHVDFYPGGLRATQPGCLAANLLCSHVRCIEYFTETVYRGNENNFIGTQCNSYAELEARTCSGNKTNMGYATDSNTRGIYILPVNYAEPYGVNAKNSEYLQLNECGVCLGK